MKKLKQKLFAVVWVVLVLILVIISLQYRNRTEALVAVVESQITAVSYHKPVTVLDIRVISGQEVQPGDTLVIVSRPDLQLDIERKSNELDQARASMNRVLQNHQSKVQLLSLERDGKINQLSAEKSQLETELYQQQLIKNKLSTNRQISTADSLKEIQLRAIKAEINDLEHYFQKEIQRQQLQLVQDSGRVNQSIKLIYKEIAALYAEQNSLIRVAQFEGVIGTVNVQLDELVPPYKDLVTIYEAQPSLIKAFKNELVQSPVKPGDSVKVVSENRDYQIMGIVQEMGARITSFPGKIQPINSSTVNYGQEIFISIPRQNHFLNGEKVYVYPQKVITP